MGADDYSVVVAKVVAKSSRRRASSRQSSRKAVAAGRPQSLLVLHLDSRKLRQDGLHLGSVAEVAALFPRMGGADVAMEDVRTSAELTGKMQAFRDAKRTFDVVAVIAHSNDRAIRVAEDLALEWGAFAQLLRPLSPRRLCLIACKAGRASAGESLFAAIPTLRRIYACPVNANRGFGELVLALVPSVLANRRPNATGVTVAQVGAALLTGRQLREWQRDKDRGNAGSKLLDIAADIADPFVREAHATMRRWLSR